MNSKRFAMITKLATEQEIRREQKDAHFVGGAMGFAAGTVLPLIGRTSSYLHPSRQGWVASVPQREVIILDSLIESGVVVIETRS